MNLLNADAVLYKSDGSDDSMVTVRETVRAQCVALHSALFRMLPPQKNGISAFSMMTAKICCTKKISVHITSIKKKCIT